MQTPFSPSSRFACSLVLTAAALSSCGEADDEPNGNPSPTIGPSSGQPGSGNVIAAPASSTAKVRADNPGLCAPASAFSYALCTCEDFTHAGQVIVRSGPSGVGSVGVNGTTRLASHADTDGSWVSYGDWSAGTGARIGGDLRSGGKLTVAGAVAVGGDVAVREELLGAGYLTVAGAQRVAGRDIFLGYRKIDGGRALFDGPTRPPCGCDEARLFDVRAAVAEARDSNDNAVRGVASGALLDVGLSHLTLSTGRYYFEGVTTIGRGRLTITGNVSIYIEGDLNEIGFEDIKLAQGATLDLYVSGAVRLVGYTPLGAPDAPSSFRLYVGGAGALSVAVGRNEFYGSIYAPEAPVAIAGSTIVVGSLFAKTVAAAGQLVVHHGGAEPGCSPPLTTPPKADPPAEPPRPAEPIEVI